VPPGAPVGAPACASQNVRTRSPRALASRRSLPDHGAMTSREPWSPVQSPLRVLALVLLLVFGVEGVIMLTLPCLPAAWREPLPASRLDAGLLTAIVAPAVWALAVSPLRQLFESRGHLLRRLFESQEQERARIARDLHDGVGQQLTALRVGLRNVEAAEDLSVARGRAHALRDLAATTHDEVRRLAQGLGPGVLRELGLVAALERLCEEFASAHDVRAVFRGDSALAARLDPDACAAVYRIVQEALANVARHAAARGVDVSLAVRGRSALLTIHDDGCGLRTGELGVPAGDAGGFGLGSIRERALMLGGSFRLRSRPGRGTAIEVLIPVGA